ncbi:antirepressor [Sphingomonas sp. DBB INV C78]|uniref:ArdC family protein n=1 Tax=Sphingomonas sp. DBB INV C78 TaxID=3349434 RepID=UPI0036D405CF
MARNLHRQVRHASVAQASIEHSNGHARGRPSLYAEVTQRIIRELEEGRLPWVQPWDRARVDTGLPRNAASHRPYSGINVLILWGAVIEHGYGSQGWLTYRQARELGGHVREGEQGVTVCFADRFCPQAEQERAVQEGGEARSIAFLKRFTVFNVDQCEGLPPSLLASPVPLPEREIVPLAEEIITNTGADFRIGGEKAYYHPGADYVQVPPQPAFHHQIDFYRTAFHELGHWTGHGTRLNRDQSGQFGSVDYAKEELIAEIASAFVCAQLRIKPTVRHADYVGAWLEVMTGDERAIFRAAAQAARASRWILDQCREPRP